MVVTNLYSQVDAAQLHGRVVARHDQRLDEFGCFLELIMQARDPQDIQRVDDSQAQTQPIVTLFREWLEVVKPPRVCLGDMMWWCGAVRLHGWEGRGMADCWCRVLARRQGDRVADGLECHYTL